MKNFLRATAVIFVLTVIGYPAVTSNTLVLRDGPGPVPPPVQQS